MFFPFSNLDKTITNKNLLYPNGMVLASAIKDNILYIGGNFNALCEVYEPYAILDTGLNISPPEINIKSIGDRSISKFGYEKDIYGNHYMMGSFRSTNNIFQVCSPNGNTSLSPAQVLGGREGFIQVTPSGVNTGLGFSLGGGTTTRKPTFAGTGLFFIHAGNNINVFNGNYVFNGANYGFGLYNQGLIKYNFEDNSANNQYKWSLFPDRKWFENFANSTKTNGNSLDYFIDTGDFYPNKTGIWVAGNFTVAAGGNWNRLVCLDYLSGTAITGFTTAAGPNASIERIIPSGNKIYLKGQFTTISGITRNRAAAITFPQINLLPFNPNANGTIRTMNTGVSGMYLAGNYTTINGLGTRPYISKVDYESGTLINEFNPMSILPLGVAGYIEEFGDKVIMDFDTAINRIWTYKTNNSPTTGPLIPNYHNPINFPYIVDNVSGLTIYTGLSQGCGSTNVYLGSQSSEGTSQTFQKIGDRILIFGKNQGAFIQKVVRNNGFAVDLNTNRITDWNPNVQMINAATSAYSTSNGVQGIFSMHLDTGDNTITLGGRFNTVNDSNDASKIRRSVAIVDTISGGLTTNFDVNFGINYDIMALEKSGNILFMGGNFTSGSIPNRYLHFMGVNINTNQPTYGTNFEILSPLFGLNGNKTGPSSSARVCCMRRKDNLLYVGGTFSVVSGLQRYGLFCLNIANNTITDFNLNLDKGEVKAMDIDQESNTLYIGGTFRRVLGQERNFGAAINLNTTGLLDWDPRLSRDPTNIKVGSSGVAIFGSFAHAGERRAGLAMFSIESGILLDKPSFSLMRNPFGAVQTAEIYNNNLYLNGSFGFAALGFSLGNQDQTPHANQLVYNLDSGNILTGFVNNGGPLCIRGGGNILGTSLESGFLYMGGDFSNVQNMAPTTNTNSTTTRNRVAWFDLNNQRISGIDYNVNGSVYAIKRKDNFLYIGGSFTSVLATTRNRLARINLTNNTLDGWNPNLSSTVYSLEFSGDKLYVGGDFTTVSGLGRNRVCRFDVSSASGGALESYNPNVLNGGVRRLAITGNNLYVAGTTTQFGSAANNDYIGVAAFDTNTASHLTTFRPFSGYTVNTSYWYTNRNVFGNDGITALHIHPSGLFVGGDLISVRNSGDNVSPRGIFLLDTTNGNIIKNYGGEGQGSIFKERPPLGQGDAYPGQIWDIKTYGDKLIAVGEFGDGTEYRYMNTPSNQNFFVTIKDKITGLNISSQNFTIDSDPSTYTFDNTNNTSPFSNNIFTYDGSWRNNKVYFHGLFSNLRQPDFRCSIAAMDLNGKLDREFKGFGV
jgi:hypothetical protein